MHLDDKHRVNLAGLHGIDREKLAALDARSLHRLQQAGYLEGAYLVLASMHNMRRLMAEKQRRLRAAEPRDARLTPWSKWPASVRVHRGLSAGRAAARRSARLGPAGGTARRRARLGAWCRPASRHRQRGDGLPARASTTASRCSIPTAAPEVAGRPFYNDDFTELNFEVRRGGLGQVLDEIAAHADDAQPPTYYVASLLVDSRLPGFREANDLDFAAHGIDAPPSIWIGNRVTASCHYDAPNNIACCAVGRRRFTLFPPEQIANLYPGPLEPTPGGQAVSVVDFASSGLRTLSAFPRCAAAGHSAVLEPGDADLHSQHVVAPRAGAGRRSTCW